MSFTFTKATKASAKLRAALFGPSGAGKTFTALRIAAGLGGAIAVIDTERGSASKYADRFAFDVLDLEHAGIPSYQGAIAAAAQAGYAVLVIDSLSHGWQELLQEIDRLAAAKYRGNTWSAWSEGTPKQRALVEAILTYPGHVIATMRSKTEWSIEADGKGRQKPVRVGLAPEQGKGIEYEFDLLLELSPDHIGRVIKDRTGKFQDELLDKPGEDFGQALAAWLWRSAAQRACAPPMPRPVPSARARPRPRPRRPNRCRSRYRAKRRAARRSSTRRCRSRSSAWSPARPRSAPGARRRSIAGHASPERTSPTRWPSCARPRTKPCARRPSGRPRKRFTPPAGRIRPARVVVRLAFEETPR